MPAPATTRTSAGPRYPSRWPIATPPRPTIPTRSGSRDTRNSNSVERNEGRAETGIREDLGTGNWERERGAASEGNEPCCQFPVPSSLSPLPFREMTLEAAEHPAETAGLAEPLRRVVRAPLERSGGRAAAREAERARDHEGRLGGVFQPVRREQGFAPRHEDAHRWEIGAPELMAERPRREPDGARHHFDPRHSAGV